MACRNLIIGAVLAAGVVLSLGAGCKKEPASSGPGDASAMAPAAAFANARCPIMGARIVPERVNAKLIREYKGEKVAFCCAGCPERWDDLSEEEKASKFAASKQTP